MTFDEQNVNRDVTGQFGAKTGSAPEARLANEHREQTARAVARDLAHELATVYPNSSGTYEGTVLDNGDVRISRNGEMFATVAFDDDGMLEAVYDSQDEPYSAGSHPYLTVATTVRNSLR